MHIDLNLGFCFLILLYILFFLVASEDWQTFLLGMLLIPPMFSERWWAFLLAIPAYIFLAISDWKGFLQVLGGMFILALYILPLAFSYEEWRRVAKIIIPDQSGWADTLYIVFITFFVLLIIVPLFKSLRERWVVTVQRNRDRKAKKILLAITSRPKNESFPEQLRDSYCLYLRPFDSTKRLKIVVKAWRQKRSMLDPDGFAFSTYIKGFGETFIYRRYAIWGDVETLLAQQLESFKVPLMALGNPGEQIGAGRMDTAEETWKKDVQELAAGARALFVLPSTAAGTTWEINYIFGHPELLTKTFFLVPPDDKLLGEPTSMAGMFEPGTEPAPTAFSRYNDTQQESKQFSSSYDKTLNALRDFGIKLPRIPPEGAILTIDEDRVACFVSQLVRYEPGWFMLPWRLDTVKAKLLIPSLSG